VCACVVDVSIVRVVLRGTRSGAPVDWPARRLAKERRRERGASSARERQQAERRREAHGNRERATAGKLVWCVCANVVLAQWCNAALPSSLGPHDLPPGAPLPVSLRACVPSLCVCALSVRVWCTCDVVCCPADPCACAAAAVLSAVLCGAEQRRWPGNWCLGRRDERLTAHQPKHGRTRNQRDEGRTQGQQQTQMNTCTKQSIARDLCPRDVACIFTAFQCVSEPQTSGTGVII
jgi:hypothetical protein